MAQLSQDYQEFVDRDTDVIAIGPEDQENFAAFWDAKQMPFSGIPDPDHTIADLYGQVDDPLKFGRNPVIVVIDIKGQIRFEHFGQGAGDIVENKQILELLDNLNTE
jgi:peroxiredoxin Q/BCP